MTSGEQTLSSEMVGLLLALSAGDPIPRRTVLEAAPWHPLAERGFRAREPLCRELFACG